MLSRFIKLKKLVKSTIAVLGIPKVTIILVSKWMKNILCRMQKYAQVVLKPFQEVIKIIGNNTNCIIRNCVN